MMVVIIEASVDQMEQRKDGLSKSNLLRLNSADLPIEVRDGEKGREREFVGRVLGRLQWMCVCGVV